MSISQNFANEGIIPEGLIILYLSPQLKSRMKKRKSKSIKVLGLVGLATLFIASCEEDHYRNCVDANGKVMPDSLCDHRFNGTGYHGGNGMGLTPFYWYYASRSFMGGSYVSGGSYLAPSGVSYSSSGISRGGFGSIGHGSGGHGGGT